MTAIACAAGPGVEARNDAFARQYDIDAYYAQSCLPIRWIEARRLSAIGRMIAARPGESILEVGCGGGHVLRLFPQGRLTGVDVSGQMLERARRNLQGYDVRLLKGQLHELGIPAASFDHVICTEVLEHTANPGAILAEIRRVLRPGGRAVITFPNDHLIHAIKRGLSWSHVDRVPFFGRLSWGGDEYHLHVWRIAEMRTLLADFFVIREARFVPTRLFPIRCCFLVGSP
jgi:ubiquinone/menaquinone biosynthesis C-methylase UbiE